MNYLFKMQQQQQQQQQQSQQQQQQQQQNMILKATPQQQINAALAAAIKKINATSATNITKLNTLVTKATTSETNAKKSENAAALTAASLSAMVTQINTLASKMDLATADIVDLETLTTNMKTISDSHSVDLVSIKPAIDTVFKFFFHLPAAKVQLDSNFKPVDPTTLSSIPTYFPSHVTYVP